VLWRCARKCKFPESLNHFADGSGPLTTALPNLSRQINAACHISMGRHGSVVLAVRAEDCVGAGMVYRYVAHLLFMGILRLAGSKVSRLACKKDED
jgi:hypothetical protein